MAKVDALGLIGDLMVGGTAGYAAGSAAQQAQNRQQAERDQALNAARTKQDGMLRLEEWKAQNVRDVARQKHEYSMEEQAEDIASKERIAGMRTSGAGPGKVPGKERIKGVANLRADYKDFIDNEFVSGADEGWWFGLGAQEGDEPPTFEEWAHGARPEEAKYYGVSGGGQQRQGDVQLEGSVADIIGRVNLGGEPGDVVQPAPITYDEQAPEEPPPVGMIAKSQEEERESLVRNAYAGDEDAQEALRLSGKRKQLESDVQRRKLTTRVGDFFEKFRGKSVSDRVQKMPGDTARALANIVGGSGYPAIDPNKLMENPELGWELYKAISGDKFDFKALEIISNKLSKLK